MASRRHQLLTNVPLASVCQSIVILEQTSVRCWVGFVIKRENERVVCQRSSTAATSLDAIVAIL